MLASNFQGLAPALVSTAELDPLRDEGEVYAAKLELAGNRVEVNRYPGAPHLFPTLGGILKSGREYQDKVVAVLRQEFGRFEELEGHWQV